MADIFSFLMCTVIIRLRVVGGLVRYTWCHLPAIQGTLMVVCTEGGGARESTMATESLSALTRKRIKSLPILVAGVVV